MAARGRRPLGSPRIGQPKMAKPSMMTTLAESQIFQAVFALNTETKCGRFWQFGWVVLFSLVALASICAQVVTDIEMETTDHLDNNGTLKVMLSIFQVFDVLLYEQRLFLENYMADNEEDFILATDQATKDTDLLLIWLHDWFRPEDLEYVEPQYRDDFATQQALALALRKQRVYFRTELFHSASKNVTGAFEIYHFYQNILDNLLKAMQHLLEGMDHFSGWSELQGLLYVHQLRLFGATTAEISKLALNGKTGFEITGELYAVLVDALVHYELFIDMVMSVSAFTKGAFTSNFTDTDNVNKLSDIFQQVTNLEMSTLSPEVIDSTWNHVEEQLAYHEATLLRRAIANVENAAHSVREETSISLALLLMAAILSFSAIFIHVVATAKSQKNIAMDYKVLRRLNKAQNMIYAHVPKGAVEVVRKIESSYFEFLQPVHSNDLCVAIIDVPTFRQLMRDPNVNLNQFSGLLERYFEVLETTLSHYRQSDMCKVETMFDMTVLATGVTYREGKNIPAVDHALVMMFALLHLLQKVSDEFSLGAQVEGHEWKIEYGNALHVRIGVSLGDGICHISRLRGLPRMVIYGDAMDLATVVHATSLPLRIQVADAVVRRLTGIDEFSFSKRAVLNTKSFGIVGLYWATWNEQGVQDLDETEEPLITSDAQVGSEMWGHTFDSDDHVMWSGDIGPVLSPVASKAGVVGDTTEKGE